MGKKYENGLVLGKFMPPQNGHLYLIDTAATNCKITHVMVCSDETQPIPGELRYKWLREIYKNKPHIKIIWCRDENPQYPNECETLDIFYKKYWVPSVYKHIKKLDVLFSSENYGDEFADYLGIKHEMVDQPRSHYAISATQIRNDPYRNWKFIPRPVRPYYTKKITILGPESTGKSTLVKKLAIHYDTAYVEEYGRTYTEISGTHSFNNQDFINIAERHETMIQDAIKEGHKAIFVDTEAIVTKVFGEMYLGEEYNPIEVDKIIDIQKFDLYLLLDIDIPWVDDGTRDFPEERESHFNRIKKELTDRNIPYVLIGGDYHERFEKAVKEVDKLGYLY